VRYVVLMRVCLHRLLELVLDFLSLTDLLVAVKVNSTGPSEGLIPFT